MARILSDGTLRSKLHKGDESLMVISLAAVAMYVLLVGVASFLKCPVGRVSMTFNSAP
jgi:hypothetical protein